MLTTDLQNSYL